jgi:hypothetical protein
MPRHSDPAYLREKAAQFRRIAVTCEMTAAAKLHEIAVELEAKAAEIEARGRPAR